MLLGSEVMQAYDKARVFLDEDFTAVDKFTVNIYCIYKIKKKWLDQFACLFSIPVPQHFGFQVLNIF